MIKIFTENFVSAFATSVSVFLGYWILIDFGNLSTLFNISLLLSEGLLLNYLCFRYGILGQKTNIVLVLFSILSVLIIPELSFGDLIYGMVWLGAFYLAFESRDNPQRSTNYMIYFGVLLGVAQAFSSSSILLFIPVFILFAQTGTREGRSFLLSFLYFGMVVTAYVGGLYVIELYEKIPVLVPTLTFDYTAFNTILIKLFLPFLILSILVHILSLNNYTFRFPNKSKVLNFTMLLQLGMALLLILITAQVDLFIYAIMASTVLLSFAFVYKRTNVFANAAFASLLCIAVASLYLYHILSL